MSRKFSKFIFSVFVFIFGFTFVNAELDTDINDYFYKGNFGAGAPSVTSAHVNGNILYIETSGYVSTYYVGTTDSYNSARSYSASGLNNRNKLDVSVKNGTYYIWLQGSTSSGSTTPIRYGPINVTSSCNNESRSNVTGSADVERCAVWDSNTGKVSSDNGGSFSCAAGYTITGQAVKYNGCTGFTSYTGNNKLDKVYCKVIYTFTCSNGSGNTPSNDNPSGGGTPVAAASLSSLTVSNGGLSPNFSSGTKKYSVSVGSDVSSVHVSAYSNNGTVVGGNERDYSLEYGNNLIYVKVKNSAGKITTYTVTVNRDDGRSSVNTLSNLTVNQGALSPAFTSDNTTYYLDLDSSVNSLDIGAVLTDGSSAFVDGYGPRTVDILEGNNIIDIKVTSARGNTKVYTIYAYKQDQNPSCSAEADSMALLKSFKFTYNDEDYDYDLAPEFDSKTTSYTAKVPYKVVNITVAAYTVDEADKDNIEITGGENLEVNQEQDVSIKVTSKTCPSISKVYHIGVTRQPEKNMSSNPELNNLTIENHSEFKFEPNVDNYDLVLNKGETSLIIKYEAEDEGTNCVYEDNKDLGVGSTVVVTCTSEDEEQQVQYAINITGVKKGSNGFLIILVIILVILIIVYLVLRLLGYKIYFNFEVVGAFFRGIGEKIRNIFDK